MLMRFLSGCYSGHYLNKYYVSPIWPLKRIFLSYLLFCRNPFGSPFCPIIELIAGGCELLVVCCLLVAALLCAVLCAVLRAVLCCAMLCALLCAMLCAVLCAMLFAVLCCALCCVLCCAVCCVLCCVLCYLLCCLLCSCFCCLVCLVFFLSSLFCQSSLFDRLCFPLANLSNSKSFLAH